MMIKKTAKQAAKRRFTVKPFSPPNENATCVITAEVALSRQGQRSAEFRVDNLRRLTMGDLVIFHGALLSVKADVEKQLQKLAKPARRKKTTRKR